MIYELSWPLLTGASIIGVCPVQSFQQMSLQDRQQLLNDLVGQAFGKSASVALICYNEDVYVFGKEPK